MQETAANERFVFAVLAAQVALIRDRADSGGAIDMLWRTADVLERLSKLVLRLSRERPLADPELDKECVAAVEAEAEISHLLDGFALQEAQRHDLARQMADCVVKVLAHMAAHEAPPSGMLSPAGLAALYVCEQQREIHDAVARQFQDITLSQPATPAAAEGKQGGAT